MTNPELNVPDIHIAHDQRSRFLLARAAARGELIRACRGAYVAPAPAHLDEPKRRFLEAHARARAVAVKLPEGSVVGHWWAALLHGLAPPALGDKVDVLSASRHSTTDRLEGIRRHARRIGPEDIVEVDGVPVTSRRRTALDCARLGAPAEGLAVVDAFLAVEGRVSRFDRPASERRVDAVRQDLQALAAGDRGHRGISLARALIAHASGFAESPLESRARRLMLVPGAQNVEVQAEITVDGRLYFSDLRVSFESDGRLQHVDLEVDGLVKYGDRATLTSERARQASFVVAGSPVQRIDAPVLGARGLPQFARRVLPLIPVDVRNRWKPRWELATPWEVKVLRNGIRLPSVQDG